MQSTKTSIPFVESDVPPSQEILVNNRVSLAAQFRIYGLVLMILDAAMIGLSFRLAYFVRFETGLPIFQIDVIPNIVYYERITVLIAITWLIVFRAAGLYQKENLLGGPDEYGIVFRATTIAMLLIVIFGFLQPIFIIARGWLLMAWLFSFLLISLGRFLLRRVVYHLRSYGYFVSRAVIIGANDEGLMLANQLSNWQYSGLHILGFIDKKFLPYETPLKGMRVLGNMEHLDQVIEEYDVDELILASSSISTRDKLLEIFQKYGVSDDVNIRMSSGLYEIITTGLKVREYAFVPLVCVNKVRLTGFDNFMKIMLDYGLTIPALIVLSPLFLLLAIAIRLDSPGPILYRRRVMGVNNRQFDAFKFRTMRIDGEEILAKSPELQKELAETHKLKNDPRITRIGRILRKFSLDELPQFFNVIRYEMSLVGPRMIHPDEMKEYKRWGLNLLTVRPGITGLWQVSGRSDLSYQDRIRLDMHYIRNWSIWLDLQLLWQTIPAVLKGRGAY
jgi:exopolysaccharide biosynthesis polyprenyl glycosylphosphotransferase